MAWTHFYDTYYKGCEKDKKTHIYIEADHDTALRVFRARFGQEATDLDCACCGRRYLTAEHPTLEQATKFWAREAGRSLEEFLSAPDVLVIHSREITAEDLAGEPLPVEKRQKLATQPCAGLQQGAWEIPSY